MGVRGACDGSPKMANRKPIPIGNVIYIFRHSLRKEIVNFTKLLPTKKRSPIEVAEVPEPVAEEMPVVLKKLRKAKVNKAI